jgi:aspartate aminotransferase
MQQTNAFSFSSRTDSLQPSASLALAAKVSQLKASGRSIVSLSVGELPWNTPVSIQEAAIQAIKSGKTRYTAVAGVPELRQAIAEKLLQDNGISVSASQVLVTAGAKQALFDLCMVLLNPGDEAIVPDPAWLSYEPMVEVAGGVVVSVPTAPTFRVSSALIEPHITSRTKLLILNSPNNPTGVVMTRAEWEEMLALAKKYDLWIVSDEVYEFFVYDGREYVSPAALSSYEKIVTINAFSKSFAMTGWRIGYCVGPVELIQKMSELLSHSTSNSSSIAQYAALAGLALEKPYLPEWQRTLEQASQRVLEALADTKLQIVKPEGGFYIFANVSAYLNSTYANSTALAEYLLEQHGVAVVPGEAFSSEGKHYVRLSFAVLHDDLEEGLLRLKKGLKQLQ